MMMNNETLVDPPRSRTEGFVVEVSIGIALVAHTALAADRGLVGIDARGQVIAEGGDGRAARVWIATRGGAICALSVDPTAPVQIDRTFLGTTWTPVAIPSSITIGDVTVRVRSAAERVSAPSPSIRGEDATRVSMSVPAIVRELRPSRPVDVVDGPAEEPTQIKSLSSSVAHLEDAAEMTRIQMPLVPKLHATSRPRVGQEGSEANAPPTRRPEHPLATHRPAPSSSSVPALARSTPPPAEVPSQKRPVAKLLALALVAAVLGVWLIRTHGDVVTSRVSPKASTKHGPVAAAGAESQPESAPPSPALPDAGPRPEVRETPADIKTPENPLATRSADRRIAEAMFSGDYQRALDESAALGKADPTSPRYTVIARVLRAKASRSAH
jgi:hypothetical protein